MTVQQLETIYGTMFVPDNDQGQYWWLHNTGASPEDDFIEKVCDLLEDRPKGCAVDVGANFGCWTLALAKHAHTVVAIEPQACIHRLLSQSINASHHRNIELIRMAAGDRSGLTQIAALDIDGAMNFGGIELDKKYFNDGWNTLGHANEEAPMEAVAMERLDITLMGYMVSFIKIDVEGYEMKVLEGAKHTIERCKPILFVEMDHPKGHKEMLRQQLIDYGYALDEMGGNFLGLPL